MADMSRRLIPTNVFTLVHDITLTPSGKFAWVSFANVDKMPARVKVPGAYLNRRMPMPASLLPLGCPSVGGTRMSLRKIIDRNIHIGDLVEITLEGTIYRPAVRRVIQAVQGVRHA